MFTCLEVLPKNEGIFLKIYEKIKPPAPQREYIQVKGATPFLRLKVRENNIDWRQISACLCKNERKILTDTCLEIPNGANLSKCFPKALGTNLIFKTFCEIAQSINLSHKISISVFDRGGFLLPQIEKLVPIVRNASVYTEKIREYFYMSSKIMAESGMSIKINEYDSPSKTEKIIIADEYKKNMKDASLVFLGDGAVVSYNTVTGAGISLENEYKILKGSGIDDFSFASALYEYNNADFFVERDFQRLYLAGRCVTREFLSESLVKQGNT